MVILCLKISYPNPASGGASCNISSFLSSDEAISSFVWDGMASPCPHSPNWHETTGTCTSIETKCGSGWNRCFGCIGFLIKLVLVSHDKFHGIIYMELLYALPRLLAREASSCCGMLRPHSVHNSTWHRNCPSAGETSGSKYQQKFSTLLKETLTPTFFPRKPSSGTNKTGSSLDERALPQPCHAILP